MSRTSFIYAILIASFIGALFFSFYFYIQSNIKQTEIDESLSLSSSLTQYHFVLIGEEMDNDYWRLVGEGAKDAEENYDVLVEYKGPRRSNIDEQLKLLDMAIAAKVDGIIVQAINDEKFKPMIDKAASHGIPVITIDTDSPNSQRSLYIGTDNYVAGKMAGEALIEDTKGQAIVAIVTGSFTSAHHQLRVDGFLDTVKEHEGITIVSIEESNITRVGAEEKAYRLLKEYPQVTAFFGTSALDGIGISSSIQSQNKEKDIYIIAFDTLPETLNLVERGIIDAVVAQEPFEIGYKSVERMIDILKGNFVEEIYHTDVKIIRNTKNGEMP